MLEYELEIGAEVSQIIWVRTQISCLSTYSNIWWRWLEAEIVDLSIFSELRLSFVLNYVWWRRGLIWFSFSYRNNMRLHYRHKLDDFVDKVTPIVQRLDRSTKCHEFFHSFGIYCDFTSLNFIKSTSQTWLNDTETSKEGTE